MNINSMSEALNKFVAVLESRNKKFSNENEDFLMPLPESTLKEMKQHFNEVAPNFIYVKEKNLLNINVSKNESTNGATKNEISEKQMYDLYQISQKLALSNVAMTSEEMYDKVSTAYSERNDILFIPNLQTTKKTINNLTTLLLVVHGYPQSPQEKEDLEKSISQVKLSASQSLEDIKQYQEKNEGLSPKLEYNVNELTTSLLKLNEQVEQYQENKRIFEKNSKDPFNFNTTANHTIDDNCSIQEIESQQMSSKHVHNMLTLNKSIVQLRNNYVLKVEDHSAKPNLS